MCISLRENLGALFCPNWEAAQYKSHYFGTWYYGFITFKRESINCAKP